VLPRQPGADIDRTGTALGGGLSQKHRAVETCRKEHGCRLRALSPVRYHRGTIMYLATKRIDFCYGHRLLDYDGVCKHPHGHNAIAEIDVRTDALDSRNMVADFSDIKRLVKGWIDRELDHKMILRHDDPLVGPLRDLGEPMYLLESNPTVERIARL